MDELEVITLFSLEKIRTFHSINTSHGDNDFRETVFVEFESGEKLVVKIAGNSFTTPESVKLWQRCAEVYRKMGYYTPKIMEDRTGLFPNILYRGKECVAYSEEYSRYETADKCGNVKPFRNSLYLMTAKMAAKYYDYIKTPSAYTLFDLYPGDEVDEVTEHALAFMDYAKTLPDRFHRQAERMYAHWLENRAELEKVYHDLPFSVFQADFNDTNVLVDENGNFVGIFDFNLAGRDEIINYLMREIFSGEEEEVLAEIKRALRIASEVYEFSPEEVAAAPLIYRCIKPLWDLEYELKELGADCDKIQALLDKRERMQTEEIDFSEAMKYRIDEISHKFKKNY